MSIKEYLHKTIIGFLILVSLSVLGGCALSKEPQALTNDTKKNTYCELKKFTAKYVNGKVYLNWLVNTNISNYYFVLEKSHDGSAYVIIQTLRGFPSPSQQDMLFSYIDSNLKHSSRTYRLRAIEPVKNGNELLLYTESKNLFAGLGNSMINVDNDNSTANK